jgi:hypothetical protein
MFHGTINIVPVIRPDGTRYREPFDLTGTWLYRYDRDCWYCRPDDGGMTESWPPEIIGEITDDEPSKKWRLHKHGIQRY